MMKQKPTPVIMVSSISQMGSDIVEIAYSLGVIDVVLKPKNPQSIGLVGDELIQKIKAVSQIDRERLLSYSSLIKSPNLIRGLRLRAATVVAIGSSAGGLLPLTEVLTVLPSEFAAGIVIAQHIPHQFLVHFVERLRTLMPFYIRIAQKGDIVFQKSILFSPGDGSISAVRTKKGIVVNLVNTERKLQPDIDEVFSSCAAAFGPNTIAVVLSGMGRDGTQGAADVKRAGGIVIAEDESTTGIFGMPRSVIEASLANYILPSMCITEVLIDLVSGRKPLIRSKEIMLIRGSVLKACVDYVGERRGEQRMKELLNMGHDPVVVDARSLLTARFYSGEFFLELCTHALALCVNSDKHNDAFLEEMGRYIALGDIAAYKDSFFSPEARINDCPTIIPGVTANNVRGLRVRVNGFNLYNREMILALGGPVMLRDDFRAVLIPLMTGWIEEILNRFAARNITVANKLVQDPQGKPCVELSLQWT
jgi:two-component system chemotaxis response regulator CheB